MVRSYDPAQRSPSRLGELSVEAAGTRRVIATLAESANDLDDLLSDVPPAERVLPDHSTSWPWDSDAFVVALTVVQLNREESEPRLEELVAIWLRIRSTGPCFI